MDELVSYASSDEERDRTQTAADIHSPPLLGPLPQDKDYKDLNKYKPDLDSVYKPEAELVYTASHDQNTPPPQSPLSQERALVRQLALPPPSAAISGYGLVLDSPPGSPNPALTTKIEHFRLLKQRSTHFNLTLAQSASFRNPRLLTNLVDFVGLNDQYGSCFPKEVWDAHAFSEDAYAHSISKAQAIAEQRKAQAQTERTKIEFESGKQSSRPEKSAAERVMEGLYNGSHSSRSNSSKSRWDDRVKTRHDHSDHHQRGQRRRSRSPLPHHSRRQ
ncbi:Meiotically up-regulated gene 151 protein [Neolecta irregularis DAH-3]|uniref:Meiotically up-regulated gene 151 protein n=1 Tax=Neolecta irregularis (strain DAH-3) TaxID=1198029 RepID=A0A1U7LT71_NEOID|nr:Meiotically up-regulated gene 151 protein [Neolecta irregularis DAH-3]|eukprot:OLL25783.1 Meiotically up-regulated gene 151 protein [Neolecta irregularis DAH-3]